MRISQLSRYLNVGLRLLIMAVRFGLMFFFAKYLEPSDVGTYGLMVATVTYSIFIVGIDFYTYSTREVSGAKLDEVGGLLKNHLALSFVLYCACFPMMGVLFYLEFLPRDFSLIFFIVLLSEHLSQELGRVLVAVNQQLSATFVLFFRQGFGAVLTVAAMVFFSDSRTLYWVFSFWVLGGVLAVSVGIFRLKKAGVSGWNRTIDVAWIYRGVKIAVPFLVATLIYRAMTVVDRYWLEDLVGLEALGAYVLFYGLANSLIAILDAGVFSFSYPSMVAAVKRGDCAAYRLIQSKMLANTVVSVAGFVVCTVVVLPGILSWVGRDVYIQYEYIYWILLAAVVVNALAMIPHYGLYSHRHDKPIILSHVFSFPVFAVAAYLLSFTNEATAVPTGLLFASIFMLTVKALCYFWVIPRSYLVGESGS